MSRCEDEVVFCLKTMCPNQSTHKSGYCVRCRTFKCPTCSREHTITQAPHSHKAKFCAQCRRSVKNTGN